MKLTIIFLIAFYFTSSSANIQITNNGGLRPPFINQHDLNYRSPPPHMLNFMELKNLLRNIKLNCDNQNRITCHLSFIDEEERFNSTNTKNEFELLDRKSQI